MNEGKKRKQEHRWANIGLAILVGGSVLGLTFAAVVIKNEGLEGLFDRKRQAVERVAPETLPILDKVEEGVLPDRAR